MRKKDCVKKEGRKREHNFIYSIYLQSPYINTCTFCTWMSYRKKALNHFFAIRFSTSVTSVCQDDMMADNNNNNALLFLSRGCEAARPRGHAGQTAAILVGFEGTSPYGLYLANPFASCLLLPKFHFCLSRLCVLRNLDQRFYSKYISLFTMLARRTPRLATWREMVTNTLLLYTELLLLSLFLSIP